VSICLFVCQPKRCGHGSAAARQSPNCILKKQKDMAQNDFQYGGWNSYTLQCGTIMTLISPGDFTLQCVMWLMRT